MVQTLLQSSIPIIFHLPRVIIVDSLCIEGNRRKLFLYETTRGKDVNLLWIRLFSLQVGMKRDYVSE
jgi:hypothetical protein